MSNAELIWDLVDEHREEFIGLADRVWGMPEICYTEYRSVEEHRKMLEQQGFRVTENVAGIPTAVMGEAGEGGPVIAIMGEYDALPGLSQVANIAEPQPVEEGGHGHGCGHNLLGSAAMLAAAGLKDWLEKTGTPGRVRYYGCPAEEGGAAKGFMVRAGAFDDVDAAVTWHPSGVTQVGIANSLANTRIDFSFTGRSSHASAAPHLGRSALDAVELMNVGVNYMREHMPPDARLHYAMLDAGGVAPNVVQGFAKVRHAVRAGDLATMQALVERVKKVAEGAALMTETTMSWQVVSAVSNMLDNDPMKRAMFDNMQRLGAVPFDAEDKAYASQIQATLTGADISNEYLRAGVAEKDDTPLCDFIVPLEARGVSMPGSTDVSDVSWAVPTIEARVATHAIGTPGHSWQITAQGKAAAAHKGMIHAAKIMAGTAVDMVRDEELLAAAKADHAARTAKTPYVCPIPEDVHPPLQPRPE
ncbi:M20 family metallopeptidase [Nisaea sp.]|uniref:M20 family metallopeptidase n=1 Tax=Nisaea sp. TaxID=2024842 RepID=UPI003262F7BB